MCRRYFPSLHVSKDMFEHIANKRQMPERNSADLVSRSLMLLHSLEISSSNGDMFVDWPPPLAAWTKGPEGSRFTTVSLRSCPRWPPWSVRRTPMPEPRGLPARLRHATGLNARPSLNS